MEEWGFPISITAKNLITVNIIYKLASSTLLEKNPHSLSKTHIRVLSLLCMQLNAPILKHTGMERTTFHKQHKTCTNDTEAAFDGNNMKADEADEATNLNITDKLRALIENMFLVPWNKILKVHNCKETEKTLADLFTNDTLEDKTTEVATAMETEGTIDKSTMLQLIADSASKSTKDLQMKILTLEQKLARSDATSNTTGATTSARSTKKKNANEKKKNKAKKQPETSASQDGHGKGSTKSNIAKRKKASNKKLPTKLKTSLRSSKRCATKK